MLSVGVGFDHSQIDKALSALAGVPNGAETALTRAINKAVAKARTQTVRAICTQYNIRPSDVRRTLSVVHASKKSLTALILQRGSPLELMKFAVTPKKPPSQKGKRPEARTQTVAGVKFGTRHVLPHAFIARMKNGHVGIYSRRAERRAIRQRYTTSTPQMMASTGVMTPLTEDSLRVMSAELDRQIELLLSQRR